MMNYALKTRSCGLKTRNFALKTRKFCEVRRLYGETTKLSGCMRYASSSAASKDCEWNRLWPSWERQMDEEQLDAGDGADEVSFECCVLRYPGTFGRDSSESFAMGLAAAAARLPEGAPLLLYGLLEEAATSGVGGGATDSALLETHLGVDTATAAPAPASAPAQRPNLPSSLRNGLAKWFSAVTVAEHSDSALVITASRNVTICELESAQISTWAVDATKPVKLDGEVRADWRTFPGLFSGGTLSEMTQSLLDHVRFLTDFDLFSTGFVLFPTDFGLFPTDFGLFSNQVPLPKPGATVIDFACGSGLVSRNDEFCIKNDESCIKNDEFCI